MAQFKPNKEVLTEEYRKVWGHSEKMIAYCVNKVAAMGTLPNGDIIIVEKETIEKDFCYGEHGYDYEDAQAMANHARTSADYLKMKNMAKFNEWVDDLEECYKSGTTAGCPTYYLAFCNPYRDRMNIKSVQWVRLVDILDAMGGSAYRDEIPGKTITVRGIEYRIATKEEIEAVLELYKHARAQHEKKVDAYIKRYGTSKVNAWTYWADA